MPERPNEVDVAERQLAAEVDAVPQRRRVREPLERERQTRHRKERAGEEEHRQDHEAVDRDESRVVVLRRGVRRERRRERRADQHRGRQREDAPKRVDAAKRRNHTEVDDARTGEPHQHPELVAEDDVADSDRRRDHGEVLPRPPERAHHRPRRLVGAELHRRRREHSGRDEVEIRNAERCAA